MVVMASLVFKVKRVNLETSRSPLNLHLHPVLRASLETMVVLECLALKVLLAPEVLLEVLDFKG